MLLSAMSTMELPKRATLAALATVLLACNIMAIVGAGNEIKTEGISHEVEDFEELGLHYGKYLKEVVAALDKDQKFTETIKNMNAEDIKSGKVADQLKHVHEDVRKKLNDLKYLEIKRLRDLGTRKNEMEQHGETYHGTDKRKWRTLGASLSQLPEHMGSHNSYFDTNDLHKLMVAATNDLEKLDKDRREDYKTYEMEKEFQFQERIKMMNETEKAEALKLRQDLKDKHDNHAKVHEPGTKKQFEEIWEKKDNLPANEFDPKTFFVLHDTNSDNFWDPSEVRAILVTEINKLYDPNNPEDDPNEMEEEYERMREHVYKEIDADKDGLISLQEFLDYSKRPQFNQDHGWEDNSKRQAYSKQDYEDFQKNREKMLAAQHGHYDPAYYANQPQNMHLPNWGLGMPAGVHPAQYYGYQVDPNHPHAQQMMAAQHQQQQHMAYQQQAAAYHQQAAAVAAGYQQPNQQQYHPQAQVGGQHGVPQLGQQGVPQLGQQQHAYQAAPAAVPNQQYHPQQQAAPQQINYAQPQQAVPQQNIPQQQQQPVMNQQQQQPIMNQQQQQQQAPPAQPAYQVPPQQQAIPQQQQQQQQQQPPVQQQQQPPQVQQVPQQPQQTQQGQAPPR